MKNNSLEHFIAEIKKIWGPLNSETVSKTRHLLSELAKTSPSENWLAKLLQKPEVNEELYRDPDHGFVLIAYTEKKDFYRGPHNHGTCYVFYAVQNGEMQMKTYLPITNQNGKMELVCRESYPVLPGQCRTYLPSDIHDTKCISESALLFRLTSCDLKKEYSEGRMIKYAYKD
jgi:hypothetical protein